jgi:hypothetical protein
LSKICKEIVKSLLKKARVLKNEEKWRKTVKKRAKNGGKRGNGARPHFIKKCGFDKSNPYIKKLYDFKKCYLTDELKHLSPFSTII